MTQSIPLILKKKYKFKNLRFSENNELQKHLNDEESPVGISEIALPLEEASQEKDVSEEIQRERIPVK